MITSILIVLNSLILPFFYTGIKQEWYKLGQYGQDLQSMTQMGYEDTKKTTGQQYQNNHKLFYFICLVICIILAQYIYLQYRINNGFRIDKNKLAVISIFTMMLALGLPIYLIFCYFYDPIYVGTQLTAPVISNPLSDFLSINYTSPSSWLSGGYILSNIIYLIIFNAIHFISINKVV